MKPNIYLDIDGVLLANENCIAEGADEFLQYVIKNYDTYWLTTHCHGDASVPVKRFSHMFARETRKLLPNIKATDWNDAKTEAIDFTKPFLWFDDDLYDDENLTLIKHDALNNWIKVDLAANPQQLKQLVPYFPGPPSGQWQEIAKEYGLSNAYIAKLKKLIAENNGTITARRLRLEGNIGLGKAIRLCDELIALNLASWPENYDPVQHITTSNPKKDIGERIHSLFRK